MDLNALKKTIEGIDIYLLDQILKNRYTKNEIILDAGCGRGRNLKWFYNNIFSIYGVDQDQKALKEAMDKYKKQKDHFSVQTLDSLNFNNAKFNHIICSAVLHFAQNKQHFKNMLFELLRVLKPEGSLFIRMTTINGIEKYVKPVLDGVYKLPDQTNRFLLTDELLNELINTYPLKLIEPYKYVNVENKRSMATILFQKL